MDFSPKILKENLARDAERLLCCVTEEQLDQLVDYVQLLQRWNQRIRLVGSRDIEELAGVHVADGMALAAQLQQRREQDSTETTLIDVGTGAGLPGIVLAILLPTLKVTLCEIAAKRVAFLHQARRALSGSFQVVHGDAHTLEDQQRFDHAVSRATFEPDAWLALAGSLVRAGGTIWVMLTAKQHAQWSHGGKAHRYQVWDKERRLIEMGVFT